MLRVNQLVGFGARRQTVAGVPSPPFVGTLTAASSGGKVGYSDGSMSSAFGSKTLDPGVPGGTLIAFYDGTGFGEVYFAITDLSAFQTATTGIYPYIDATKCDIDGFGGWQEADDDVWGAFWNTPPGFSNGSVSIKFDV